MMSDGLSLIETLLVVAIVAILMIALMAIINPLEYRDKAVDSRKKSDLDRIETALENYYSDEGCYPQTLPCGGDTTTLMHHYLGTVPCQPDTNESYSYQPASSGCPSYYRLYTVLSDDEDAAIAACGCSLGCGPGGAYNYGVSSSNIAVSDYAGCNNNDAGVDCYYCQEGTGVNAGECECNHAGEENCIPGSEVPPGMCFFTRTCDGNAGGPMP